jgi:hypothetical protein
MRLPREKRQPHLVFAVSRLLGAPEEAYPQWRAWMVGHWPSVRAEALVRTTQTNEPGRTAALLPLLAQIEGPIALLEVGASAGLCLYPDRYSYEYVRGAASPVADVAAATSTRATLTTAGNSAPPSDVSQSGPPQSGAAPFELAQLELAQSGPAQSGPAQSGPAQSGPAQSGPAQSGPAQSEPAQAVVNRIDPEDGPSEVVLRCEVSGDGPLPSAMPQIVWRAGIDLQPLDVSDDADLRWLHVLVGPEQHERRDRISAAARIVRADKPHLYKGDVADTLAATASAAPADATLVVLVVGVLVYLPPERRAAFSDELDALVAGGARWISLEDPAVFPSMSATLARHPAPAPALFPLALDGEPLAWCAPHGQSIAWL